ncbi:MAG: penicillin-binding protein activator [Syntrophales bacterium]|nr:penicillin-binding protein activator [Syntrophales bacterium]
MCDRRSGSVKRWRGLASSLLIVFSFLSGLAGDCPAAETPSAERYAIGCILPLSGRNAAYGSQALDAVLLAAGVFNSSKETRIRVLIEDSQSEPAVAGAAVGKLADAGVTCILGPLGSQEALEAAKEAQRLRVPILTLTQREGITGIGDYVFRNFLTAAMQVRTVVQYAQTELGLRRFAVLYPDDPYGNEMARLFREEVRRKGGEIRKERSYKTDQTDFVEEILALGGVPPVGHGTEVAMITLSKQNQDFEALFIPDAYDRVAMIAPQLAYYDLTKIRLLGTSGWDSPELLKADPKPLEGAVFVDGFFADSFRPEVNDFIENFYTAYGREPVVMEALVYDAADMTVRVLAGNQDGTGDAFRKGLLQLNRYPGVTGRTSFPPTRDAEKELFVLMVKDGKIVHVK